MSYLHDWTSWAPVLSSHPRWSRAIRWVLHLELHGWCCCLQGHVGQYSHCSSCNRSDFLRVWGEDPKLWKHGVPQRPWVPSSFPALGCGWVPQRSEMNESVSPVLWGILFSRPQTNCPGSQSSRDLETATQCHLLLLSSWDLDLGCGGAWVMTPPWLAHLHGAVVPNHQEPRPLLCTSAQYLGSGFCLHYHLMVQIAAGAPHFPNSLKKQKHGEQMSRTKGRHIPARSAPFMNFSRRSYILLLTSCWPELSHMVTPSCKRIQRDF